MKRESLGWIVAAAVVAVVIAAGATDRESDVGRFQAITAERTFRRLGVAEPFTQKELVLVDTSSGAVWVAQGIANETPTWIPFEMPLPPTDKQ